ncbi:MAG TPA: hypothetical protein VMV00_02150 [Candidatus Baltobacteraceae bacterium]|nr:hypothetical protein [Candidatus Baltobacteraceae bacterium]
MITGFTILSVDAKIDSAEALPKQRFPRLNINIDKVSQSGEGMSINYAFIAEYFDGEGKEAKSVGQIKLMGVADVEDTKPNVAEAVKKWADNKTLPVKLTEELINGLNFRCGATGTLVAYSLGLIPPLVITTTKVQEQK